MSGTHHQGAHSGAAQALVTAVGDAVQAPSIFNTQPWVWRTDASSLTLHADPSRRLPVVDPDGTMLLLSCGAALHHARVSLAAQGWAVEIDRQAGPYGRGQPDPESGPVPLALTDPLARIRLVGRTDPDPTAVQMRAAIPRRRTDRRPYGDDPVRPAVVAALAAAAWAQDTRLHRVRLDQMPMLAVAVAAAQAHELASPRYRIELIQWTNRPEWSNDGVPPATAVRHAPRRVPVRDFALPSGATPEQGMPVPPGGDRGAVYLILHGPGEAPQDWVRAGEALSAVLLTAVNAGLAVSPFSDVLEVDHPRDLVRGLLPGLEKQHPYLVVRCGHATGAPPVPASPRRGVDEVLHRDAVDTPAAAGGVP
jgi:hypothetical protein